MDLHRRIRTLRLRRGLTGMELAKRAGVSPSYVSLIEHGEKVPSEQVAVRLAGVLGEPEDRYRIWAATARMDAETRAAVMRSREPLPAPVDLVETRSASREPVGTTVAEEARKAFTVAARRPPGRPPRSENRPIDVSYRLDDDRVATLIQVPLLAPGCFSMAFPPAKEEIEGLLSLDPRLIGRRIGENAPSLVALRATEESARNVACWIGSRDIVVVDRRPGRLDPSMIHAFMLEDELRLSRACVTEGTLFLLPLPTSTHPPRTINVEEKGALEALFFGTVTWSSRAWALP